MNPSDQAYLQKVTAFITRTTLGEPDGRTQRQLLFIRHPYAGVQIPAGTVELGEEPVAAALREACEETGLCDLHLVSMIGYQEDHWAEDVCFIILDTIVYARPDRTSFDWARMPRGAAVRSLRQAPGWLHVAFEEPDRWPDPQYATYQICGWVPRQAVAEMQRRYFYHLEFTGKKIEEEWDVFSDNHTFHAFWAPLEGLPIVVKPQDAWLEYVTNQVGYNFMENTK
jgi:8-oxo-dGTP pyrophosphatase MutT (NUDIX family)